MASPPPAVHIDAPHLGMDTMCDLLSAERRHRVLWALEHANGIVMMPTLAEHLAEGTDTDAEDVEKTLTHQHLPKLADAEVIEYDRKSGAVALAPDVQIIATGATTATERPQTKREDVADD